MPNFRRLRAAVQKDLVLWIALLLALLSSLWVTPSLHILQAIDLPVLEILFSLMCVMEGLEESGCFDRIARAQLSRVSKLRALLLILVFLCFFFSMFITNDVALLTFVPFSMLVLRRCGQESLLIPTVVLQTLAANLGSMLTPLGNPQNLFLFETRDFTLARFFGLMLPYALAAALLLLISCLFFSARGGQGTSLQPAAALDAPAPSPPNCADARQKALRELLCVLLFFVSLLSVLRLIPYHVAFVLVLLSFLLWNRPALRRIDYALLLTFVGFFIFTGNLSRIPAVKSLLQSLMAGYEVESAILLSQLISNVPAALLLSGFTEAGEKLLIGVNLGGLGTLIASMASLISYKLYTREYPQGRGRYIALFSLLNLFFLLLLYMGGKLFL